MARISSSRRRGVCALLLLGALASVAWRLASTFALPVPRTTRTTEVATLYAAASPASATSGSRFVGLVGARVVPHHELASPGAAGQRGDVAPGASGAADATSLALAAAGAATAMRAMSAAAAGKESAAKEQSFFEKNIVAVYIGLWFLFNIFYNVYNKQALNAYPYPWACALWQMIFGWFIFVPLWLIGARKAPKLTVEQALRISPSAIGHLATHVGAVIAFAAGAVSFGHIVKASEPVVSSILNAVFMGEVCHPMVYASLLPIIGGVGLASASEMSFNWLCFGAAMGSNIGSAARAVYSKKVMSGGDIGENMTTSNTYAVLTIMATFMLIPIACYMEGPSAMISGFKAAHATGGTKFLLQMLYSGFFYYAYNEVAFLALGKLDPVSHAVSNTMKRVVIIITSIVVFKTAVTPLGVAGSSIAILGTLLYSLAKNKFK